MSRHQAGTCVHTNLRVSARVYDVRVGAIFSKNRFFGTTYRVGWTPRLQSPSLIMAPGKIVEKSLLSPRVLFSGVVSKRRDSVMCEL